MEGITEQSDSPSDRQSPSRIWGYYGNVNSHMIRISLYPSSERGYTTAQVCQHIGSYQGPADRVRVCWTESAVCSDSDLMALGNAMHGLQGVRMLCIDGTWTDEKASVFLRHVAAKTSVRKLNIKINGHLRIPSILAETQVVSFLRTLELESAELDEDDCRSLEQVLQGHHHGQDFTIEFNLCSFPSFIGFFIVADAAINTGSFLSFISHASLTDASIPDSAPDSSTMDGETHDTFYNIYEREKDKGGKDWRGEELEGKDLENYSFRRAAGLHMNRYNDLNLAGRWKLLRNEQKPTVRECVGVLCHDTVRNCVDYLFHFITMNPDVYAAAAAAVKND